MCGILSFYCLDKTSLFDGDISIVSVLAVLLSFRDTDFGFILLLWYVQVLFGAKSLNCFSAPNTASLNNVHAAEEHLYFIWSFFWFASISLKTFLGSCYQRERLLSGGLGEFYRQKPRQWRPTSMTSVTSVAFSKRIVRFLAGQSVTGFDSLLHQNEQQETKPWVTPAL